MPNNIISSMKLNATITHHPEDVPSQDFIKTTVTDRVTSMNDEESSTSPTVFDRITSINNDEQCVTNSSEVPERNMSMNEEGTSASSTIPDRIRSVDDAKEESVLSSTVSVSNRAVENKDKEEGSTQKVTKIKNLNADEAVAIHQLLSFNKSVLSPVLAHRDFADASIDEIPLLLGNRQLKNSFPIKLYSLLERSEADGYSSIISWTKHGRAFNIYNFALFVKKIMPIYFYQTKMSSFIRQLSTYGFHKITGETNLDKDSYYHELFLRGREDLCPWITRQKKRSLIIGPDSEPDFFNFKPMPVSLKMTTVAKPVQYYQPPPHQQPQQQQPQINIFNINNINMMQAQQQVQQYEHQNHFILPRKSLLESIVRKLN